MDSKLRTQNDHSFPWQSKGVPFCLSSQWVIIYSFGISADPGFPIGGANVVQRLCFEKFVVTMKESGPLGSWWRPLEAPWGSILICIHNHSNTSLIFVTPIYFIFHTNVSLVLSNLISDICNVKSNMVWETFLAFAMGNLLYWFVICHCWILLSIF